MNQHSACLQCNKSSRHKALHQDWRLVKGILEYRLAESAKRQHNVDATKLSEAQVNLWGQMCAALVELKGQG